MVIVPSGSDHSPLSSSAPGTSISIAPCSRSAFAIAARSRGDPVRAWIEEATPRPVTEPLTAFGWRVGATVTPDWILVPTSPLSAYTVSPDELATIANREYVRDTTIAATHGAELSAWFDQQDLFFAPFTTFTMRDRPGPEIQIFRRNR
jgi:hypothetical protein